MPLIHHHSIQEKGEWGLWEASESLDFFKKEMSLYPAEAEEISILKSRKLHEWYSSRYLLHFLSSRAIRGACLKDKHGKPYLQGSDHFISMSHSRSLVAVIAHRLPCGIDVQYMVSKITRIQHKFCHPLESEYLSEDHLIEMLHYIWGAKECIYKAYGLRNIDYQEQIAIHPFTWQDDWIIATGSLMVDGHLRKFDVIGKKFNDYVLVYAYEVIDDIGTDFTNLLQKRYD